jgi:hypothetical protein
MLSVPIATSSSGWIGLFLLCFCAFLTWVSANCLGQVMLLSERNGATVLDYARFVCLFVRLFYLHCFCQTFFLSDLITFIASENFHWAEGAAIWLFSDSIPFFLGPPWP